MVEMFFSVGDNKKTFFHRENKHKFLLKQDLENPGFDHE